MLFQLLSNIDVTPTWMFYLYGQKFKSISLPFFNRRKCTYNLMNDYKNNPTCTGVNNIWLMMDNKNN